MFNEVVSRRRKKAISGEVGAIFGVFPLKSRRGKNIERFPWQFNPLLPNSNIWSRIAKISILEQEGIMERLPMSQ